MSRFILVYLNIFIDTDLHRYTLIILKEEKEGRKGVSGERGEQVDR